jgi:hypothetical protein
MFLMIGRSTTPFTATLTTRSIACEGAVTLFDKGRKIKGFCALWVGELGLLAGKLISLSHRFANPKRSLVRAHRNPGDKAFGPCRFVPLNTATGNPGTQVLCGALPNHLAVSSDVPN